MTAASPTGGTPEAEALAALLLEHGAAVDGVGPDGRTALMFAAMFDRVEVVEALLRHGASPERRDGGGARAVDLAQAMGAERAARVLGALHPGRAAR